MRVRTLPAPGARAGAVLIVVAAALLAPVMAAAPAAGGGPTSVLLSAPGIGRTGSLYTTDADYRTLAEALGAEEAFGASGPAQDEPRSQSPERHAAGNGVTATWLMHDVMVWRVDRVYVDAAGGPWIATQMVVGGTVDAYRAPITWHRSARPAELVALLTSMGLLGGTSGAGPGQPTTPVTAASSQPGSSARQDATAGRADRAATGSADGTADGFSPALAALLGLVAGGAVAGLVSVAVVRRSTTRRLWEDVGAPPPAEDDVLVSGAAGPASVR